MDLRILLFWLFHSVTNYKQFFGVIKLCCDSASDLDRNLSKRYIIFIITTLTSVVWNKLSAVLLFGSLFVIISHIKTLITVSILHAHPAIAILSPSDIYRSSLATPIRSIFGALSIS